MSRSSPSGIVRSGRPVAPPRLWDPIVRLTHWGIAISVLLNAMVTEEGGLLHISLGWIVLALLLMRLVWGLIGPAEARFSAFPPNPVAAVRHLRQLLAGRVQDHPSHNPAGALMAYAFWATLAVVTATGLLMTSGATPMQVAADKAAVASGDWSDLIREEQGEDESALKEAAEEVHEVAANLLLIMAALHVAGVALESRALRRSLVNAMLFGDRRR